jgi:hypothetical protein
MSGEGNVSADGAEFFAETAFCAETGIDGMGTVGGGIHDGKDDVEDFGMAGPDSGLSGTHGEAPGRRVGLGGNDEGIVGGASWLPIIGASVAVSTGRVFGTGGCGGSNPGD